MNVHDQVNRLDPLSLSRSVSAPTARRRTKRPIADVATSGSIAALLVVLGAVFAETAVIEGTAIFHPLATLALIGACTVLIGGRIRTLSALEEDYIDAGLDESQARTRAKETLDRMTARGVDRPGS